MGLAPRDPAGAAPLQRRAATAQAAPPRSPVAEGPVEDWMAVALRPDLHQTPILRKSMNEIGYAAADAAPAPVTSSGQAMPARVQARMESALGADFSAVRIHQGPEAQAMGALAYTQGSSIHFAPGQYDPGSQRGQELLGHELAHVVQQSEGRVQATAQAKGQAINDDASLEREADQLGAAAASFGHEDGNEAAAAPRAASRGNGPAPSIAQRVVQRYIDPAVTAPLGVGAPTQQQFYDLYFQAVKPDLDKVLARLPDDRQGERIRRALEDARLAFFNSMQTVDGRYGGALRDVAAPLQALNTLVTRVNQDLRTTEAFTVAEPGRVKLGTEFTFTRTDLHELDIGEKNEAMRAAMDIIASWRVSREAKESAPHVKTKAPFARKFEYHIPELGRSWWWILDIDAGCIETQTDPISTQEIKDSRISRIIAEDIFEQARSLGLSTDKDIGGGHLSLDRATTFGEDPRALRNFLVLYTNQIDLWSKMDNDFVNAPFIQELPVELRQEFANVIQEFDTAYNGPAHQSWTIDRLVDELEERVFTFIRTTEQIGGSVHYQAINVEHMNDEDESKRRIEMRRFRAQTDLTDLLYNHMQALEGLIEQSRETTLVPLAPMSNDRINADKIQEKGLVDTAKIKELQKELRQHGKLSQPKQKQLTQAEARTNLLDRP